MARDHSGSNIERSEYYGALQRIVDVLFEDAEEALAAQCEASRFDGGVGVAGSSVGSLASEGEYGSDRFAAVFGVPLQTLMGVEGASPKEPPAPTVRRLDVVIQAEAADLPDDLVRIVNLIPPGDYTRQRLCDQLNSAITGHAWGQVYGTVE